MALTQAKKKEHIKNGCVVCPYCGSADVRFDSPDYQDASYIQAADCASCGREWRLVYRLADIVESDEEQQRPAPAEETPTTSAASEVPDGIAWYLERHKSVASDAGLPAELPAPDRKCRDRGIKLAIQCEGGLIQSIGTNLQPDDVDLVIVDHDALDGCTDDELQGYGQDLAELTAILPEASNNLF